MQSRAKMLLKYIPNVGRSFSPLEDINNVFFTIGAYNISRHIVELKTDTYSDRPVRLAVPAHFANKMII